MAPTLVLNPAGRKMESTKVLIQPATPILIFLVTICLMVSVSGFKPYDYMQFVVQWQPALYPTNPNYSVWTYFANQRFTIHGLWPSNFNGSYVRNRRGGQAFDINEVKPIQAKLEKWWPNVLGDNVDFWRYEWKNHGICSLNVFRNQLEYFDRAVTLYDRYNERIERIVLRAAQIIARYDGRTTRMKKSEIYEKIYEEFGARPALRCYQHRDYPGGSKQLQEVILCFDKKGEVLIDCPSDVLVTVHLTSFDYPEP